MATTDKLCDQGTVIEEHGWVLAYVQTSFKHNMCHAII